MSIQKPDVCNPSFNLDVATNNNICPLENNQLEDLKEKEKNYLRSNAFEKILNKNSKKLLIKKNNKWRIYILLKKRKEEKNQNINRNNLIKYWNKTNICADKYSYALFIKLKIVKYINYYFAAVYPDQDYPLFDEYESFMREHFRNESALIQKVNFFNPEPKNTENENIQNIVNDAINVVENNIEVEEEEYSFFSDVDRFCDNCLKNKSDDSQELYEN